LSLDESQDPDSGDSSDHIHRSPFSQQLKTWFASPAAKTVGLVVGLIFIALITVGGILLVLRLAKKDPAKDVVKAPKQVQHGVALSNPSAGRKPLISSFQKTPGDHAAGSA
jgi:hypothetical protein